MPRPPAVPAATIVDAEVCARAGATIARRFSGAELPRLREAGGHDESSVDVTFRFSQFEQRPALSGELHGAAVLTCQRCMRPVAIEIDDTFQVLIVDEERSDEPGGYEPVVANASRLDLGWLAEEQVLLALPLVPTHESEECAVRVVPEQAALAVEPGRLDAGVNAPDAVREIGTTHQPFRNLRDLMGKH